MSGEREPEPKVNEGFDGSAVGSESADPWWHLYRRDFAESVKEIDGWWELYRCEFVDSPRQIDEWYQKYRKDFMPDRLGRVFKGSSEVVRRRVDVPVREFEYVGHGGVTNPNKCQQFVGWGGCLRHDKHKDGLIWAYKIFNSCDSPKCSRCYRSWASRLAHFVKPKLVAGSKVHGDIEHVMVSLSKNDWDLPHNQMKDKTIGLLKSCGIHSGYIMLHGKSFGKYRPHFHTLAYVDAVGGAERCRSCGVRRCYKCDGIYGRIYRSDAESGYIIKVLPKRLSVGGTLFYEAEHCTIDYSRRRVHAGVWFGSVSYSTFSRLGVEVEKDRLYCPECGGLSGRIEYSGDRQFVLDKHSLGFARSSFEPYVDGDKVVWHVQESYGEGRL